MFKEITDIEQREIIKGYKARFVHTKNVTLAFWEVDENAVMPEHSHIHEQTCQVTEGKFEMSINGESRIYYPGQIVIIPSNVKHSGTALTFCKLLDIFSPVREDYLTG